MRNRFNSVTIIVLLAFVMISCGGAGSSGGTNNNVITTSSSSSSSSSSTANSSSSVSSSTQGSSPLQLSLYPQHEDTSVKVSLDLTAIYQDYAQLGVIITSENSQPYSPLSGIDAAWFHTVAKLEPKVSSRVATGLKPGTTYELCLTGLKNNFLTTGYFNCETITTAPAQDEVAVIALNYDVEAEAVVLLKDWQAALVKQHPNLKFTSIAINKNETASAVKEKLKNEYAAANVKYVVLVGYDLPSFPLPNPALGEQYLAPFDKLSNVDESDWINDQEGFSGQVILSVIKPRASSISSYLKRLISYYRGELQYSNGVLIADAMKSDEKTIDKNFFYNVGGEVSVVEGITEYESLSQANLWQADYVSKLKTGAYQYLFLAAHGSSLIHYPCADKCIDYAFLEAAQPKVQFIVAVSCSIGQVMQDDAPMASYVFESGSLSGLGAEVSYWDVNGNTAKSIYHARHNSHATIGEAGRPFGFLVFGDPFLRTALAK